MDEEQADIPAPAAIRPTAPDAGARRGRRLSVALRALGWTFVALFYGSLLWVGAYRIAPPPATFTMMARAAAGETVRARWVRLEEISPHLVRAVIAAEDSRFCLHRGLDFDAIEAALEDNKSRARPRGASTISQQTAKNLFLWTGGGWLRKGAEAWFTLLGETLWGKRRTMELYLNVAEWGDGLFGAEAAAQARFSKSAKDLTPREAALLAAVLPSPNKWRVDPPGPYVSRRADMLRKRMDIVRRDGLDACLRARGG
jgi:monofunctional biosynthetic peptidoglycan transglycosylase